MPPPVISYLPSPLSCLSSLRLPKLHFTFPERHHKDGRADLSTRPRTKASTKLPLGYRSPHRFAVGRHRGGAGCSTQVKARQPALAVIGAVGGAGDVECP